MTSDAAYKGFLISGKTAANVAHAEISLVRAEDRVHQSVYQNAINELLVSLEVACLTDKTRFDTYLTNRFMHEHRGCQSLQASDTWAFEKLTAALRYSDALRWISQQIPVTQKISPETLLDLHSRCIKGRGHHQSNIRFRRKLPYYQPARNLTSSIQSADNAYPRVLELCNYVNTHTQSPLTQAAIAYLKYTEIEPFEINDPCTQAAFAHAILLRRGLLRKTVAPLSLLGSVDPNTVDVERFVSTDDGFSRTEDSHEVCQLNAWINLFAASVELAAHAINEICTIVEKLEALWKTLLGKCTKGSMLEEILSILPAHPVLTVESITEKTGKSFTTVNDAFSRLEKSGVLFVTTIPHHKTRIFKANEALGAYEKLLDNTVPSFLLSAAFRTHVYN